MPPFWGVLSHFSLLFIHQSSFSMMFLSPFINRFPLSFNFTPTPSHPFLQTSSTTISTSDPFPSSFHFIHHHTLIPFIISTTIDWPPYQMKSSPNSPPSITFLLPSHPSSSLSLTFFVISTLIPSHTLIWETPLHHTCLYQSSLPTSSSSSSISLWWPSIKLSRHISSWW